MPNRLAIPESGTATLRVDGKDVRLTNLDKVFWERLRPDQPPPRLQRSAEASAKAERRAQPPSAGKSGQITKGQLIQYYADVAPLLIPHIRDRAMVMKRYPHGAAGEFFFMKRAPVPRPDWIRTCSIVHDSGNVIDFPVIDDLPSLLWLINLGCIDLNQWYARCDDVNRPDYVHFDLDPGEGADWNAVLEAGRIVRDALKTLELPSLVKTTGSRGLHVYVPIVRGLEQKDVWTFAKALAVELASRHASLMTAEYRVAKRPKGRVLVDYNQNAWGRTLASIYSVRPRPEAPVSTPVTWAEIDKGVRIEDFRIDNVRKRLAKVGDLWKPLLQARGRADLKTFLSPVPARSSRSRRKA